MNKTIWIVLGIIIVAVAIILGVTLSKPNANETSPMTNPTVTLQTNEGAIVIELFADQAPNTAGNFAQLASEGFYDGTRIHRVMPGFMIQGGDPKSADAAKRTEWGTGGPGYQFADEFVAGLSNKRGYISMANAGPNTNGSQFFILVNDSEFLDNHHAVFGKVVGGMEIVDLIANSPHGNEFAAVGGGIPIDDVIIEKATVSMEAAQ